MEKKVHLKGRLLALSEFVNNSKITADIGCDHGRLSVALLQQGRADHVYASDISVPSLKKTELLCEKCGLSDRMHVYEADGLSKIPCQPDTIIIAGMGGRLISEILENGYIYAHKASHIIIQPMRGIAFLRQYLYESGYTIQREKIVRESGRFYQLIDAVFTGDIVSSDNITYGIYDIGEYMVKNKDPYLPEYLHLLIAETESALAGQNKTNSDMSSLKQRYDSLNKLMEVVTHEN